MRAKNALWLCLLFCAAIGITLKLLLGSYPDTQPNEPPTSNGVILDQVIQTKTIYSTYTTGGLSSVPLEVTYTQGMAGKPLVVALHSYTSNGWYEHRDHIFKSAMARGWSVVSVHFRTGGSGLGTGHDAAIQDVMDGINDASTFMDYGKVYAIGGSGGGYMEQMMVTRYPNEFDGGVSIVGFSDLREWWKDLTMRVGMDSTFHDYRVEIKADVEPEIDLNATKFNLGKGRWDLRSPRGFIGNFQKPQLWIHGIFDTTVSPLQSLDAFSASAMAHGNPGDVVPMEIRSRIDKQNLYSLPFLAPADIEQVPNVSFETRYRRRTGRHEVLITGGNHSANASEIEYAFRFLEAN